MFSVLQVNLLHSPRRNHQVNPRCSLRHNHLAYLHNSHRYQLRLVYHQHQLEGLNTLRASRPLNHLAILLQCRRACQVYSLVYPRLLHLNLLLSHLVSRRKCRHRNHLVSRRLNHRVSWGIVFMTSLDLKYIYHF